MPLSQHKRFFIPQRLLLLLVRSVRAVGDVLSVLPSSLPFLPPLQRKIKSKQADEKRAAPKHELIMEAAARKEEGP